MHVVERDAVLVVQPAAHVDGGGVRPFRRADGLALEVGGGFDPALLVDVERREAEQPRADDRQADDVGLIARHLGAELRERQLAHVPFAVEGEAREHLVVAEREPGVVDALGLDQAEAEVAEMVVVGGGDGELDARHWFPLEAFPARQLQRGGTLERVPFSVVSTCAERRSRLSCVVAFSAENRKSTFPENALVKPSGCCAAAKPLGLPTFSRCSRRRRSPH